MSRARFVSFETGIDVFVYKEDKGYYVCTFCKGYDKITRLYGVSEIIDHKFKVHCKTFVDEDGRILRYELREGHEIFAKIKRI